MSSMNLFQSVPQPDPIESALPHNVWLVQQTRSREQRALYVDDVFHSQKMPPELARRMIEHLRLMEGATILDPFCGMGTTGVEAMKVGCRFVGIEIEEAYVEGAKQNLREVDGGDMWEMHRGGVLDITMPDVYDAIVTSPPYGSSDPNRDSADVALDDRDDEAAADLAATGSHGSRIKMAPGNFGLFHPPDLYMAAMAAAFARMRAWVRPGSFVLVAVREYWDNEGMIDLPGRLAVEAKRAGLLLHDKIHALDVAVDRWGQLTSRASAHRHAHALKQLDGRSCPKTIRGVTTVLVLRRRPDDH